MLMISCLLVPEPNKTYKRLREVTLSTLKTRGYAPTTRQFLSLATLR